MSTSKKATFFPRTATQWQDAIADFLADVVVIFLIVFLVIRPLVIAPFQVRQQSMEPNVHDGEYILVVKLPYNRVIGWTDYERGDVVVFRPETNPENYLIKRVIGLPGETLRIEGGHVWLQDTQTGAFTQLNDDFLAERNQGNTCLEALGSACSDEAKAESTTLTVPEGEYFVMGDNRTASRDGRTCFVGRCEDESDRFLARRDIEGRAWVVFFPIQQARALIDDVFTK